MSINQRIDNPGTYYLALGFDARPHGGSANPVLNTNVESIVPFGDPDMSLFAGISSGYTWRGMRDPITGLYANINTGLEGQPVPEPATMLVVLAGLGAIAGRRIKGLFKKN
jgi:hypothetical protein